MELMLVRAIAPGIVDTPLRATVTTDMSETGDESQPVATFALGTPLRFDGPRRVSYHKADRRGNGKQGTRLVSGKRKLPQEIR